jgi:site-specific recombinase XerD
VPARDHGASRISHILSALKSFLRFSTLAVGLETMDLRQIRLPRIPKREVPFLTPDEIRQHVAAIPLRKGPRSYDVDWLSFRVLVEVLLGSGARISEALSLKRTSINLQTGEATIIGKGNIRSACCFCRRSSSRSRSLSRTSKLGANRFVSSPATNKRLSSYLGIALGFLLVSTKLIPHCR